MESKDIMTPEAWEAKKREIVSDFVGKELDRLDVAEADGVPFDEAEGEGNADVAFADSDMGAFIEKYPMAGEVLGMLEKADGGEGGDEVYGGKVESDGCVFAITKDGESPDWDDDEDDDE